MSSVSKGPVNYSNSGNTRTSSQIFAQVIGGCERGLGLAGGPEFSSDCVIWGKFCPSLCLSFLLHKEKSWMRQS